MDNIFAKHNKATRFVAIVDIEETPIKYLVRYTNVNKYIDIKPLGEHSELWESIAAEPVAKPLVVIRAKYIDRGYDSRPYMEFNLLPLDSPDLKHTKYVPKVFTNFDVPPIERPQVNRVINLLLRSDKRARKKTRRRWHGAAGICWEHLVASDLLRELKKVLYSPCHNNDSTRYKFEDWIKEVTPQSNTHTKIKIGVL